MYKLFNYNGKTVSITRLSDGASIPIAFDNTDYQAYLKWIEAGNTPEPAEETI